MARATADVIVIGAGVAGLAAAARLCVHGKHVVMLEARSRAGGRILTCGDAGWPRPVELGAEFIHSGNAALWRWIRRARLKTRPIDEQRWLRQAGRLVPMPDAWDRINAVMRRIGPQFRGSFADWVRQHRATIDRDDEILATAFVKGFQGAPPETMSAHTLYLASREGEVQMRPAGGYDGLVRAMLRRLTREGGVDLQLETPVSEIRWRRHLVRVVTSRGEWVGRAAVITLPLGVLRARRGAPGAITFHPALGDKCRAWGAIESGHAIRVIFRMRADVWQRGIVPRELRARSGHAFGFVQSAETDFPVWWAEAPSPILVGWTGGPAAAAMAGRSPAEIHRRAEATLAKLLGASVAAVHRSIVDRRTHDWAADIYTRGAYSFATAGKEKAPARLARPVRGTLFFAGEATADPLELGTVHGAIATGERAAREILAR